MTSVQSSIGTLYGFRRGSDASPAQSSLSISAFRRNLNRRNSKLQRGKVFRVMAKQIVKEPPATFAREMERLSAKEALLLACEVKTKAAEIRVEISRAGRLRKLMVESGAGGFEALVEGKVTDLQRVDVMERITILERLNPTPRPTTSPYLEGRWDFEWFGSSSPASSAARFLLERFPTSLASISKMDVLLKDTYAKITAYLTLLNSVECKLIFSSKLSVQGPLRIKEEYFEGFLESPTVIEEVVPEQLRTAVENAVQQLPVAIRDAISSGITVPLTGTFERMFVISYLDEEILIIRDAFGVPEVLTRWDAVPSPPLTSPLIQY